MAITVKRSTGYVNFCADLSARAEWEDAGDTLEAARKDPSGQLVDTSVSEAVARVQALEAVMAESIHVFRIQAIPKKRWQELSVEHGPREDNPRDAVLGVNTDKYFDAVAMEPGCIVSVNLKTKDGEVVDFDPKTEWMQLADDMTSGQYNEFVEKFLDLNRGSAGVPFSRVASLLTRRSEQSSASPAPSESATSA